MDSAQPDLALRPLSMADVDRVHEWTSQPMASRFQTWGPHDRADTIRFVEEAIAASSGVPQIRWVWGAQNPGGSLLGVGEAQRRSDSTFEISYSVHTDHWGQGIGTAMADLLVSWVFSGFESAERVQATCDPRNTGSAKVLQRIGMTYEGTLRHTLRLTEGWRDSKMFSALRAEWPTPTAAGPTR